MNINELNIAIKINYTHAKVTPTLITKAQETLTPVALKIYNTLSSFAHKDFMMTSIEAFAEHMSVTSEQFNAALQELIKHKYLNYTQLFNNGEIYYGNAFEFIPDNTLVAVVPSGYVAKTEEEYAKLVKAWKKPHFFTGKVTIAKETY